MENNEQQILADIIERAQKGEFSEFHYIASKYEFRIYSHNVRASKLIIKLLTRAANKLFKTYCKEIVSGNEDLEKLLAYAQMREIIEFYRVELQTFQSMIDEFEEYLRQGNFWNMFLGGNRFE